MGILIPVGSSEESDSQGFLAFIIELMVVSLTEMGKTGL